MGWVKSRHRCDLPLICHPSAGKVGEWFECDYCKLNWQVQARVKYDDYTNALTFVRREGDFIITRSWRDG